MRNRGWASYLRARVAGRLSVSQAEWIKFIQKKISSLSLINRRSRIVFQRKRIKSYIKFVREHNRRTGEAQAVYTLVQELELPSENCLSSGLSCLQACARIKLPSGNCLQSGEAGYTAANQAIGTQRTSQKKYLFI